MSFNTNAQMAVLNQGGPISVISYEYLGGGLKFTVFNRQSRVATTITFDWVADGALWPIRHSIIEAARELGSDWDSFAT